MFAHHRNLILVTFSIFLGTTQVFANALEGTKTVYLVRGDKTELPIGTITFSAKGNGVSASVKLESDKFADHFLSMRPFRCITEDTQAVCHLPYPYKLKNEITSDDFRYLEYQFLFIHRKPEEYGINFWNGMYYRLTQKGDGSLQGILMETDFNELASPPEEEFSFPFADADLTEALPEQHRFPQISIR